MLNRYNRQSIGLGNYKQLERKIKETLLKDIISLQDVNKEFKKEFLLDLILEETRNNAVISALRRCFLSILRVKGYKMIKSDYMVPYEEDAHVFWRKGEIDSRIDALTGIIQKDKMLNRHFGKLTTLLKELWQANKLLDNPVVVYNEFKNDG